LLFCHDTNDGAAATLVLYCFEVLPHPHVLSVSTPFFDRLLQFLWEARTAGDVIVQIIPQKFSAPQTAMPVKNGEKLDESTSFRIR
jgi:hypothetical protein